MSSEATVERMIVAIDGPSGVGKSTVARRVAERLEIPYLETGAMYRALGWQVLQQGVDAADREAVEELAARLPIDLLPGASGTLDVRLAGESLGERVRAPEVSEVTSRVSVYPGVRARMVALQRQGAARYGAVLEGRDIGTKVFPQTPYKFFLEAPNEVRIERRLRQLRQTGGGELSRDAVEREIAERDERDREREDSPLMHDESYTVIDTGACRIDEVVELVLARIEELAATRSGPT